jgi:c-di-GMP-binding flagellar brake protein YcgR
VIALPNIYQSIGVYVVDWEVELRSRIEDASDGSLTIAMPSDGRSERPLPRGASVYLDWISDRGVVRVRGVVSEFVQIPIPALQIVIAGESEIHQRRNYVRASANLTVSAAPLRERDADADADAELEAELEPWTVSGTTFDLSGGGMRVRFHGYEAEIGDRLRFEVVLPDETVIRVIGTITRRPLPEVYCVQFDEIDQRAQERVVRLVFERLRVLAGRTA